MKIWALALALRTIFIGTAEAVEDCSVEGSLRLVGWERLGAGRIEICRSGLWGTICADGERTPWSEKNAQVACRSLGYSGALNSILHNTMPDNLVVTDVSYPIHYSQVQCTGEEESILDCAIESTVEGCTHSSDAAIVCRSYERVGHVRLMGHPQDGVGAVELLYPQIGWTGICADSDNAQLWIDNVAAAQIVCRQLGYEGGTPYVQSISQSAIENRSVTIDGCDVEAHFELTQCNTTKLSFNSSCSSDDVGWVECALGNHEYGNALKVGSRREGVVQLEFNGRMGHICDTGWDRVDAEVACVEFNLDDSFTDYDTNPEGNYSRFISDLMPIWVTSVGCTTTVRRSGRSSSIEVSENDIIDCDISGSYPIGFTDCHTHFSRERIAQVDCGTPITARVITAIVLGVTLPVLTIALIVVCCFLYCCCEEDLKRLCSLKGKSSDDNVVTMTSISKTSDNTFWEPKDESTQDEIKADFSAADLA